MSQASALHVEVTGRAVVVASMESAPQASNVMPPGHVKPVEIKVSRAAVASGAPAKQTAP
jgi:hypothetical protein